MNKTKQIIGLTGLAGSGKDSTANIFKEDTNVQILSFAHPLKDVCELLFDLEKEQLNDNKLKEIKDKRWGKSPRELMQWFGTDIIRNFDPDFFVKKMENTIINSHKKIVIITDVRFENEFNLIKKLGGIVIEIKRPEQKNIETCNHISENGISNPDYTIINTNIITTQNVFKNILINKFVSSS